MSRRGVLQVGGILHGQHWSVKRKALAAWRVSPYPGVAGLRIGGESGRVEKVYGR
jgi:hypothetical protein